MSEALLKTIEPARKPFLPARADFLSGLTSELSPWSMRGLAEVMIRVLPPKTNVWTLVNAMKDVGNERSAPWWSDKNPVFRGTPSGYSAYKILGGTALAKIDVPF